MSVGEASQLSKKGEVRRSTYKSYIVALVWFFSTAAALLRKVCWCAAIHIVISCSLHRHFSMKSKQKGKRRDVLHTRSGGLS